MNTHVATLSSVVAALAVGIVSYADDGTRTDRSAMERARQRVAAFEREALSRMPAPGAPNEGVAPPDLQADIRFFFDGLQNAHERIAAIEMIDSRYVKVIDGDLAADLLGPLVRDEDPVVREAAADAIAYVGCGARYRTELLAMVSGEAAKKPSIAAIGAMSRSGHRPFLTRLGELVGDDDPNVRIAAARSLTGIDPAAGYEVNVRLLEDAYAPVRRAAIQNLAWSPNPKAIETVEAQLEDTSPIVREEAVLVLGRMKSRASADLIAKRLADAHPHVRSHAAEALGRMQLTKHAPAIAELLADEDVVVRRYATIALGDMGDAKYIEQLTPLRDDEDEQIRRNAERSIEQLRKVR